MWYPISQIAFEKLKQARATTPVMALPDFNKHFCIETNAYDTSIGVVLSQEGNPSNQKVSIYEKEVMAITVVVDRP